MQCVSRLRKASRINVQAYDAVAGNILYGKRILEIVVESDNERFVRPTENENFIVAHWFHAEGSGRCHFRFVSNDSRSLRARRHSSKRGVRGSQKVRRLLEEHQGKREGNSRFRLQIHDVRGTRGAEGGVKFVTLRKRHASLLREAESIPKSGWRKVEVRIPKRTYRKESANESEVKLKGCGNGRLFQSQRAFLSDNGQDSLRRLLDGGSRYPVPPAGLRSETVRKKKLAPTISRKFIDFPGRAVYDGDMFTVKIRKRAYTPVLKSEVRSAGFGSLSVEAFRTEKLRSFLFPLFFFGSSVACAAFL